MCVGMYIFRTFGRASYCVNHFVFVFVFPSLWQSQFCKFTFALVVLLVKVFVGTFDLLVSSWMLGVFVSAERVGQAYWAC